MVNKYKILPVSIIIAGFIIGGFVYMAIVYKQKSEERIREMELKAKELENEKERQAKLFDNNLKCQELLDDLKKRWSNVVGIYYSEYQNTCIVRYINNGVVEESAVENMQDVRK